MMSGVGVMELVDKRVGYFGTAIVYYGGMFNKSAC